LSKYTDMKRGIIASLVLFACALLVNAQSDVNQPSKQYRDSIKNLSVADRQNMMDQLGIKDLRPGVSPDLKAANAANYDDAKAFPYNEIPELLVLKNGKKVTSPEVWIKKRRPELFELFDREVYGRTPLKTPEVRWEVVSQKEEIAGGVPVIAKILSGHVDNSIYPAVRVDIKLKLVTPKLSKKKVPVILEFSWFIPDSETNLINDTQTDLCWQYQLLQKGWGYAYILPTSIQADNGAGLREGIIGLVNKGNYRKPEDWGALKAWAWGAGRVLDYFETIKSVDATRVGITGHSRYGKAALVCMAYDSRFRVAFITSSGEGGAKIHRHYMGEILENITSNGAYHWMAGNFLKYASTLSVNDLPVDSHQLIALCAPRPVFISSGDKGDEWADAKGMFLAAVHASPAYELLGVKGITTTKFPQVETNVTGGRLGFRQHKIGHIAGPNWPYFIEFAAKYLN